MIRLFVLAVSLGLAACGANDHDDLRIWMEENSKGMRGSVPKLPEVKPYQAIPYEVDSIDDPFKPGKIEPESRTKARLNSVYQPDFEARELRNSLLEKYPLESLKMIGYFNINNRPIAAIAVDGKVKQIKVGDYVGLDFGMVTKITEKEVALRELIQDATGDWSERTSYLYLQGKEESKK